jgi:hypothetical protein
MTGMGENPYQAPQSDCRPERHPWDVADWAGATAVVVGFWSLIYLAFVVAHVVLGSAR